MTDLAEPVVIEMPAEAVQQPARTRMSSLFLRLFHHRPRAEQHQEQMEEFRAEEWLAGDGHEARLND
jgi:hypothetical protein